MNKTYKGYELYKMIAENKIKEGTKFKNLSTCEVIVFDGENLKDETSDEYLSYMFDDIKLVTLDFELIEDEIDIQNIETIGLKDFVEGKLEVGRFDLDMICKLNEIVEAVKQLDRKIK